LLEGVAVLNTRQRMYITNKRVRDWLLKSGYDEIWFKRHTKRNDLVFTQRGTYLATDLWNLFDGICQNPNGGLVYLQMKTNAWPKAKPLEAFAKRHGVSILVLNVTNKLKVCHGKYKLFTRWYE
jgi:hypothetical protein